MNQEILNSRLNRIVSLYENLDHFIDTLPVNLPNGAKNQVKKILKNEEIDNIIYGIKERRPPRLLLVGDTGVGKSSLINAIFGEYVAKTSPVNVGTTNLTKYKFKSNNEIVFEVIDSRGLADEPISESDETAEDDFKKAIHRFDPDAILFLTNAADRARMDEDANEIQRIFDEIGNNIPMVTILNRVDDLHPSRIKNPNEYPDSKIKYINDKKTQMEDVLKTLNIDYTTVIHVSSYIEWNKSEPHTLSIEEQRNLYITFDGRYNIDNLLDFLENNIDFQASIDLMINTRIEKAIRKISNILINSFAVTASTISLTPIPFSDIVILVPLQLILIIFIAYLSGIDIELDTAKEFLVGVGGVGILGYGLRTLAQQGSKFLNLVIPGSGSAVSSTIAYSGTYAIGKASQAFYIDNVSENELDKIVRDAAEEGKNKASDELDKNEDDEK